VVVLTTANMSYIYSVAGIISYFVARTAHDRIPVCLIDRYDTIVVPCADDVEAD